MSTALHDVFVKPFVPSLLAYSELLGGHRGLVRCLLAWLMFLVVAFMVTLSTLMVLYSIVSVGR